MDTDMRRNKGFTLIELMIVIGIIGVLSSVIMVKASVGRAKTRDSRRVEDAASIKAAVEHYYDDWGHYPCSDDVRSDIPETYLTELVNRGYLTKQPIDPDNNNYPYIYWYASYKATTGGPCGQYAEINYDVESKGTPCVDGRFVPITDPNSTHCHIILPDGLPVPPCNNKWDMVKGHGYCIPVDPVSCNNNPPPTYPLVPSC